LALIGVIAVAVIGLAVGVSPSGSSARSTTTATTSAPAASAQSIIDSPGFDAAGESCTLFASLISDLQAGKVTPSALTTQVASLEQQAEVASATDPGTFGRLASDAEVLARAIDANDTTTGPAAKALAADCQAILRAVPAGA
jgi:hypothetical protein